MTQPRTLKRWSLALLCLFSVSCASISQPQADETTAEKCIERFTEIMEIQKLRQMLQYGADEMILRHDLGKISKAELSSTLIVWSATEKKLKKYVTKIYDKAYAENCFDTPLDLDKTP